MKPDSEAPIFVHGIQPRSGTNHLMNLLCAHPDCAPPSPIWEDHLITHVRHLDAYVEAVSSCWNPKWGIGEEEPRALLAALGDGMTGFLQGRAPGSRVVTKTPRVEGITRFSALFPRASLLILVRDGRAVVESGVRSFGWDRDSAIHDWTEAARNIQAFEAAGQSGTPRHRVVRYESLVEEPESTLQELLHFLDLDADRYDFEKALALPVLGSSELRVGPGDRVHWRGVAREADFDPIQRWRHWSRWQHARFNHVAGDAMRDLGYATEPVESGPWDAISNLSLDLRQTGMRALRPAVRAWRRYAAATRRRSAAR